MYFRAEYNSGILEKKSSVVYRWGLLLLIKTQILMKKNIKI